MLIQQLISPVVPILVPTDTGSRALYLMEENNLTQLPLVIEEQYTALVQESDVLDWEQPELQLNVADFLNYKPAVFATSHPYDAMRIAHQQNLFVVPVIDNEHRYLGSITRNDLLKYITETSGMNNPGGIIVLEIDPKDYTLYEIAMICENEDTIIISTQLYSNTQTGKVEVTIKTNRNNLQGVIASLERHKYTVKEVYGEQNQEEDILDRYKLLMNYINM